MSDHYSFRVEWSAEDEVYVARCIEFPSLSAHGSTAADALDGIQEVVDESVQWLKEDGEQVPQPIGHNAYRGNILFRTTPDLHREVALRAQESGISINQLLSGLVQRNVAAPSLDQDLRDLSSTIVQLRAEVEYLEQRLRNTVLAPKGTVAPVVDTTETSNVVSIAPYMENAWLRDSIDSGQEAQG